MNPLGRRRRLLLAVPAVAYAALILFVSSRPGTDLPSTGIGLGDKWLHVLEYFVFGLLLILPARRTGWWGRALVLAVGIAYAAFDESFQTTIPGRIGDVADFVMDVGGLLAAVILDATVRRWRRPAKES